MTSNLSTYTLGEHEYVYFLHSLNHTQSSSSQLHKSFSDYMSHTLFAHSSSILSAMNILKLIIMQIIQKAGSHNTELSSGPLYESSLTNVVYYYTCVCLSTYRHRHAWGKIAQFVEMLICFSFCYNHVCMWLYILYYSLEYNRLTSTGAVALAKVLQETTSLEELK